MAGPGIESSVTPSPKLLQLPRREILGVPVHAVRAREAVELCRQAAAERSRLQIGVVNAAKIVHMRSDALLRDSVLSSDLILADGMSVVTAGRILGQALPERVTGIDLFESLLGVAEKEGFSVYFLGASRDVLDAVLDRARRSHPRLRVAGHHDGYFSPDEEPAIAAEIAKSAPHFLFVGITSPKKEVFMKRWGPTLNVPVCHGVGGSFDVYSGKTPRAPLAWQRAGLEWLYRVIQEPARMWRRYLVTNTQFIGMVLARLLRLDGDSRLRGGAGQDP